MMVWPRCATLLPLALASVTAAPAHWPYYWHPQGRVAVAAAGGAGDVAAGRIYWAPLGDLLEMIPFLPFTVNVPDVVSAMWSYVSGWLPGGGGGDTADTGSRPEKTKKKKKQKEALTRADLVDYFIYDR